MPLNQTSGNVTTDAYGGGVAVVPNYIEDVFSTYLITGAGTSYTINNGIDLSTKGGMTWLKRRNAVNDNEIFDTVRGAGKGLITNDTTGQFNDNLVDSFTTTGFTGSFLTNNSTNVTWTFRKQPKFFDIVTYTGNGTAGRTVSHNLGSTPGCIIVKRTDAAGDWMVYHRGNAALGVPAATVYERLNTTAGFGIATVLWNDTAPTDTNFTLGTFAGVNANGGTYVAYLFAHDAGGFGLTGTDNVISCGSFTTNSSGNASVNLGYEPQWVLKRAVTADNWTIRDSMRGFPAAPATNGADLSPNSSDAESTTGSNGNYVPTATGFDAIGGTLSASTIYIYIAIRRGPMKVPTDATKVFQPSVRASGTGAAVSTTGVGFPPDLLISSERTSGVLFTKGWHDRLRGNVILRSDTTNNEAADSTGVTAYGQDGFSFGTDGGFATVNYSGSNYVYEAFRRAPSFFDEVCFSGNYSATSYNHNLAAVPEMIIIKKRTGASDWPVYHIGVPSPLVNQPNLNTTVGYSANNWFSSTPTSSVFSTQYLDSGTSNYVAYLFATCAGVSKVGSYTGNGTTQAIACGFTGGARFVLIKRTDSTGDWYVYDTARGMTTLTDPYLLLNSTAAESATLGSVTTTTGGFTVNASILAAINTNAASYIFLAIA